MVPMRRQWNAAAFVLASAACLSSLCLLPSRASAAWRPFLYGSGQWSRTEKEIDDDRDHLLIPYTVKDDSRSWELGGGIRLFSRNPDPTSRVQWEVRPRFGIGGGDLAGNSLHVSDPDSARTYSFAESFDYSFWSAGVSVQALLGRGFGLFAGPGLQSVKYEATRDWEGAIPRFCALCGSGKDQTTVRYGLLEVGLRMRPTPYPLTLETSWIPKRVQLSTTRRADPNSTYAAKFADLTQSFGARLLWDF